MNDAIKIFLKPWASLKLTVVLLAAATFIVFPPSKAEASKPFSVHGFLHNAHFFDKDRSAKA